MQSVFAAVWQVIRRATLAWTLAILVAGLGAALLPTPASYAANFSGEDRVVSDYGSIQAPGEPSGNRPGNAYPEESYDQMVEAAENPRVSEEEYEKNLKTYREEHPEGLVDRAKEMVNQVRDK